MTKIYVGLVVPEVLDVFEHVVASDNQYPGYSGARIDDVRAHGGVWRDHMKTNEIGRLEDLGLVGAMLDLDDEQTYRDAALHVTRHYEIGCGESRAADWQERLKLALKHDVDIQSVSGWTGTRLCDGMNSLDHTQSVICCSRLRAAAERHCVEFRGHNCDWLRDDDLRALRDRGVTEFNFAPELGYLVTTVVLTHQPRLTGRLEDLTRSHGGWRRWHSTDWRYGGHYALSDLRDALSSGTLVEIKNALVDWKERKHVVLA